MDENVLENWKPHYSEVFGKQTIHCNHTLHTSSYFSDEALADLIEQAPETHYHLHTMNTDGHDSGSWREGEIGKRSGDQVLEAIYAGQLWLQLRRVHEFHPRYAKLLKDIFVEFENNVPGLETFKHDLSILISSPGSNVFYHSDVPGQMLWQMRGHKKVYVYPNSAPFLPQDALEKIVLNQIEEGDIRYETWFDDYAEITDLQPGNFLHWDLNGPHRIVNGDCVNVSMTTEHFTSQIRKEYAVNYANGLLRKYAGVSQLSRETTGATFWMKAAFAAAHKFSGIQSKAANQRMIEFVVDPKAPFGYSAIPPKMQVV